tara:strand:- start:281 stop:475 length:195 start_codon:yes stop_codon:yes gene_type:complete
MKVGDLVKNNHPSWLGRDERIGVIVGNDGPGWQAPLNRTFRVLWRDGTIGKNVWDYDLKIVKSS